MYTSRKRPTANVVLYNMMDERDVSEEDLAHLLSPKCKVCRWKWIEMVINGKWARNSHLLSSINRIFEVPRGFYWRTNK